MSLDLHTLSLKELTSLRADVDTAIKSFEARRREEALAEMKEVAKKHGFDMSELASPSKKGAKSPSVVRFRDPSEPKNTWSGRGRKPNWLVTALGNGKDISEFAV